LHTGALGWRPAFAFRRRYAIIAGLALKETIGDPEESQRGGGPLAARLIRVMRYDAIEAGGGPAIEFADESLSLGRGDVESVRREAGGAAFDVTDAMMSRQHARIVAAGRGQYVLEDLSSRNGTWVDGRAVSRAALQDGQLVETGRTAWLFRLAPVNAPTSIRVGPTRSFSPKIFTIAEHLARLAPASVSLLLTGETGTGKEIFARELHARSGRRGQFVAVNCGALTESLLESELFGHRRGAFTGALSDRAGHVEAADGGTLFLDEIGEMPPSAQVRLLRVLQEGEVMPVGGTAPRKVDVRVVAATHRNLLEMVAKGTFREDLYARLEGWVLSLPRLVDRREDIGELMAHAVRAQGGAHARATIRAARALLAFDWPFNIRQLVKTTEAAIALAQGGLIELEHLPERVRGGTEPARVSEAATTPVAPTDALDTEDLELRDRVVAALRAHGGNVTRAAQALGKQRQQMQRWMRRFALRAEDFGGAADE
jgi:DNA-binding NtrC family response regulator